MPMEQPRKNVTNRLEGTMSKYDDIINLPHHVSKNRTPMSMENRAAQFAPFAALTGHDEALAETARLTTPKKLLSDDEMASLTRELTLSDGRVLLIDNILSIRRLDTPEF